MIRCGQLAQPGRPRRRLFVAVRSAARTAQIGRAVVIFRKNPSTFRKSTRSPQTLSLKGPRRGWPPARAAMRGAQARPPRREQRREELSTTRRAEAVLRGVPGEGALRYGGPRHGTSRPCAPERVQAAPNPPPAPPRRSSPATRRDSFPRSLLPRRRRPRRTPGVGLAWSGDQCRPGIEFFRR